MIDYSIYQSPFSWRYGSEKIRQIWSEYNTRKTWRELWVYLAQAEFFCGLLTLKEFDDIDAHRNDIDIEKSLEYEKETKHDLAAELKVFQEQCSIGGNKIHICATSMDIKDNSEVFQIRESLNYILNGTKNLLRLFGNKIDENLDVVCMGYTHLQSAEPTTIGYRLASYAQDVLYFYKQLKDIFFSLRWKGFRGAVGTGASFEFLLGEKYNLFERICNAYVNMESYDIVNQTYPRQLDYSLISALAGLCGALSRFAFDMRVLQSSPFGEVQENFDKNQIGSSAMAWKKNPISCEKICSLAREISVYPQVAWNNMAQSILERTLDDSANRRTITPESFLITDEVIITTTKVLEKMVFNYPVILKNYEKYIGSSQIENLMNTLIMCGANRNEMYKALQECSQNNWPINENSEFLKYLSSKEINEILLEKPYLKNATEQASNLADKILDAIKE